MFAIIVEKKDIGQMNVEMKVPRGIEVIKNAITVDILDI